MSLPIPPAPTVVRDPANVPGLVQGQQVDSVEEWNVSQALDRLKIEYTYQYPLNGGRARGGQMIDFVAWTPIGGVPVFVQGAYWHDTRHDPEGIIKQEQAKHAFNNEPVLIWDYECDTPGKAYKVVRERVWI